MKKRLNEEQISNELRGGSLYFAPRQNPPIDQGKNKVPRNVTLSPKPQGDMVTKGQGDKPTWHPVTKAPSHHPQANGAAKPALEPPLSEREYFRCSIEEVEAIEDLKTQLRRDLGIHTSKQDIERFAVKRAIEEYRERGEQSHLVTVLRKGWTR